MTAALKVCLLLISLALLGSASLAPLIKAKNTNETVADEYIVVFKKGFSVNSVQKSIAQAKSFVGQDNIVHEYQTAIQGFAARLNEQQLQHIRKNPSVEFVEVNTVVSASSCQKETAGSWGQSRVSQKVIDVVNFPYKATSTGGKGVTAYVVDTGVYIQHDEFEARATFGFKANPSWSEQDRHGHGTHVASTVGGKVYGIAKHVKIVAVKVLGDDGYGTNAGVIAGVDYVAQQHKLKKDKSTANLSLGGSKSIALNNAIKVAVGTGVVFVVAAGNDNSDACNYSPASEESAVTVGSTELKNNKDVRSYFSNHGSCVDIFAPGTNIKGAWIGSTSATKTISGTSMASPHVCGLTALLLGDNVAPAQVKSSLHASAHKDIIELNCGSSAACKKSPNAMAYNNC